MTSIFRSLPTSYQTMINRSTNDAINGVVENSIPRDGRKLYDSSVPLFINSGAEQILNKVGIDINGVTPKYQPIIQQAYDAGKNIIQAKIDGTLNDKTVPEYQDYNTNESLAYNDSPQGFLASEINKISDAQAVLLKDGAPKSLYDPPNIKDQQVNNNTNPNNPNNTNPNNLNNPNNQKEPVKTYGTLSSTESYATVLDGFAPKAKFLFIVHFTFNDKDLDDKFSFLIHKFDRPDVTVEYDEINFYNFRTHVPKIVKHGKLSFEIHDDLGNNASSFTTSYLRRISPLFNQREGTNLEYNGLNFEDSSVSYGLHLKGLDPSSDQVNLIKDITVYHLYNYCNTMDVHRFNNPKLETYNTNEFNMADGSVGSSITLSYVFDNYYIDSGVAAVLPDNVLKISELTGLSPTPLNTPSSTWDPKYTNLLMIGEDKTPESSVEADTNKTDYEVPLYDENGEMVDTYEPSETLKNETKNGLNPNANINNDQLNMAGADLYKPTMVNDLNTMTNKPITNTKQDEAANTITPSFQHTALKD